MDTHKTLYYKNIDEAMEAIRVRFKGYEIEIEEDLQKKFDYFKIATLPYSPAQEILSKLC